MTTHLLIAVAGSPELLDVQLRAIRTFMPHDLHITVIDDSRQRRHASNDHAGDVTGRLHAVATHSGARYLRFPQWLHFARWRLYPGRTRRWSPNASPRTADALQFGLHGLPDDVTRLAILDSDMIPIRRIELDATLADSAVWILPQERTGPRGPIVYPWPGIFFCDLARTAPISRMNWDCTEADGVALDTGGAMRSWLGSQPFTEVTGLHSGRWRWRTDAPSLPTALHAFLDIDAEQNGGTQYCELFLDSLLHMRAGSNWNGMDPTRFERRRSAFIDGIRQLIADRRAT